MSRVPDAADVQETANTGPSLDSEDQQERIEARRHRITARIDAKRREARGEDPSSDDSQPEEARRSHKQIEDSRQRLCKLVSEGTQLVTNIQVASDSREALRRAAEEELRTVRLEMITNEAKSSLEKFEEISKKWLLTPRNWILQELWALLDSQQQQCAQLIEDKNKLIGELSQELKRKDDQYVKDLKKQGEDIDLLVERMEEQVKNLIKTYRNELLQIEKAFEVERRELLDENWKKWEQGMQTRRDKELESLMSRIRKVEEYEQQLKQLHVQDGEEYNVIKIKLETDVQILQQQLQQMKATYQLNQEKLEYNFQVLKKRDEENIVTKSQQKRKITRLHDVLNKLRMKLEKQVKQNREENQALADDFERIVRQYKEVQRKQRHFAAVEAKKFHDIWVMNEEEMKQLLRRVLDVDRIIQEQQLGLAWKAPDLGLMDNIGPLVTQPKKQKSATAFAQEILTANVSVPVKSSEKSTGIPPSPRVSPQTIRQILELLCDESGFLIESKLVQLLSPLEKDERCLMKLDAVFRALQIDVEDDVYRLVNFFLQYKQDKTSQSSSNSSASPPADLIHPNDVLRALRDFTMDFRRAREKSHGRQSEGSEERDSSQDAAYWCAAARLIPESRLKIWEALESALEKYYGVLTNRSQLITETSALRQQNEELRMLLHQYLNSKINTELEIPPTQILQVCHGQT